MKEISLHLLDLLENSLEAGATRITVTVDVQPKENRLAVEIDDNGLGMTAEQTRKVQDPFVTSRTTRKVGMGIPLFKAGCLRCGGTFLLESEPGRGTRIGGTYALDHIDRPPMGDLIGTVLMTAADPRSDLHFICSMGDERFDLDTAEIKKELDGVPITEPEVINWLSSYLRENLVSLFGGAPL